MITRQELEGKWNEVKGRIQEKWGALTDDELQRVRGNANALVGVIEQKTGASRRVIEEFLDEAIAGGASAVTGAMESAREFAGKATEFAGKASDKVREQYDEVAESVRAGYEEAEDMVRRKPVESVAVAFGAGIVTGVLVGLLLHSGSRD